MPPSNAASSSSASSAASASLQPAMNFSMHARTQSARSAGSSRKSPHFARIEREAEDARHARQLYRIAHRQSSGRGLLESAQSAQATREKHEYFTRTMNARKESSRRQVESQRKKYNLLLLQRLQQIALDDAANASSSSPAAASHTAAGTSTSRFHPEWQRHERRYEQALARLSSLPRPLSSRIMHDLVDSSPLHEKHRVQWDEKRANAKALGRSDIKQYHDTRGMRDSEFIEWKKKQQQLLKQNTKRHQPRHPDQEEKQESSHDTLESHIDYATIDQLLEAEYALGPDVEDERIRAEVRSSYGLNDIKSKRAPLVPSLMLTSTPQTRVVSSSPHSPNVPQRHHPVSAPPAVFDDCLDPEEDELFRELNSRVNRVEVHPQANAE